MTKNAIEIENLSFQYPGCQRVIFSAFDWQVRCGDFWVIIGANGSGKTTLIRLLLGLETIQRGSIQILGKQLGKPSGISRTSQSGAEQAARSYIGHVPQHLQFDVRLPIRVLDVVEGGALSYSFWRTLCSHCSRQRTKLCLKALSQVGMEAYAKERFSMLSGGQKQRVLIARALATQSPILILDEPTASVDPNAAREIVQICHRLKKKHTILFISHDISMIPHICEHILCLVPPDPAESPQSPDALPQRGTSAHCHDVRGLLSEDILLLLYRHWGLSGQSELV